MSCEGNDELMNRLITLCENIQRDQARNDLYQIKLIVDVKNEIVSLFRFLSTLPIFPDEQTRKTVRDQIAHMEQKAEQVEHELAKTMAKLNIKPPGGPSIPPDSIP